MAQLIHAQHMLRVKIACPSSTSPKFRYLPSFGGTRVEFKLGLELRIELDVSDDEVAHGSTCVNQLMGTLSYDSGANRGQCLLRPRNSD